MELGKLNILFDGKIVTTSELLAIVKLVNIGLGLAYVDSVQRENKAKYEALKHSFYRYISSRNREVTKSISEIILPPDKPAARNIAETITRLRYRLQNRLDEPDFRELTALLESIYVEKLFRKYDYSERNLQRRLISDLVKSEIFEKRQFNLNDFSEWLSIDSENRISEIKIDTTTYSHEYVIKFFLIGEVENPELIQRQTLLTYNYIVALFDKQQEMPGRKLIVPAMPDNFMSILAQYNRVYIDIGNQVMKLALGKD